MRKYFAAVCQMDSQDDNRINLLEAEKLIYMAADQGAQLLVFPETVNYMGNDYRKYAEPLEGETAGFFCEKAKQCGVWIVAGTFQETDSSGKPKNTLLFVDPKGNILCKYSKLHMFDVNIENGPVSCESEYNTPGDEIVMADTVLGRMGFAVCYDLRFGEIFRLMALAGAKVVCVPSAFALESGKDHWEALIRARAIENGIYIVAADQFGSKPKMRCYGNSMIADPWGTVIARIGEHTGYAMAQIDLDYVDEVQRQIPSLANRREDIYSLSSDSIKIY